MLKNLTPHDILFQKMALIGYPQYLCGYKLVYFKKHQQCDIIVNEDYFTVDKIRIMLKLIDSCKIGNQIKLIDNSNIISIERAKRKNSKRNKNNNIVEFTQVKLFM